MVLVFRYRCSLGVDLKRRRKEKLNMSGRMLYVRLS